MEQCKTILEKREKDIIAELEKVYHLENYSIEKGHKNSINIENHKNYRRKFILYYNHYNATQQPWDRYDHENRGAYRCYHASETLCFLTKEELLNHLIFIAEIKDREKFYDICLQKINLIEELEINYCN